MGVSQLCFYIEAVEKTFAYFNILTLGKSFKQRMELPFFIFFDSLIIGLIMQLLFVLHLV